MNELWRGVQKEEEDFLFLFYLVPLLSLSDTFSLKNVGEVCDREREWRGGGEAKKTGGPTKVVCIESGAQKAQTSCCLAQKGAGKTRPKPGNEWEKSFLKLLPNLHNFWHFPDSVAISGSHFERETRHIQSPGTLVTIQ